LGLPGCVIHAGVPLTGQAITAIFFAALRHPFDCAQGDSSMAGKKGFPFYPSRGFSLRYELDLQ
jgi:hypothetical protein